MSDTRAERAPDPDLAGALQEAERALRELELVREAAQALIAMAEHHLPEWFDDDEQFDWPQFIALHAALAAAAAPSGPSRWDSLADKARAADAYAQDSDPAWYTAGELRALSGPGEDENSLSAIDRFSAEFFAACTPAVILELIGAAPSGEPPSEQEQARWPYGGKPYDGTCDMCEMTLVSVVSFADDDGTTLCEVCADALRDAGPQPPETT